jgi:hypothetical protein
MKTKYIIANINLPLKIDDDGTYSVMSENIEIKFENYEGSLPIPMCQINASDELSKIIAELFVDNNENSKLESKLKSKLNRKNANITFKNNTKEILKSITRYSVKNRN